MYLLEPRPYGPIIFFVSLLLAGIMIGIIKLRQFIIVMESRWNDWQLTKKMQKGQVKSDKALDALKAGMPPVLYLRPFTSDGIARTVEQLVVNNRPINIGKIKGLQFPAEANKVRVGYNAEEALAQAAERIGPFVAIAEHSGDKINLGAARIYFSNEEWQLRASELMEQSAIIFVKISGFFSKGFYWEMEQIRSSYLSKTIFLVDIHDSKIYAHCADKVKNLGLLLPGSFREFQQKGPYFSFDAKGQFSAGSYLGELRVFHNCVKAKSR